MSRETDIVELSERCARADLRTWVGRGRRARIVAACVENAPTREHILRVGKQQAKEELKGLVTMLLAEVIWAVIVGVISGIIINWILKDGDEARLIDRCRG